MDSTWEYLNSDWYSSSRSLIAFIDAVTGLAVDMGDADAMSVTFNSSNVDRFRKNTEQRILGKRIPNQLEVNVALTLTQLNPQMMAAQWMGKAEQFYEQDADAEPAPIIVPNYTPGKIVLLPNNVLNATIVEVTLDAVVVPVEQFRFDKMSASLQVSSKFELADGQLSITYTQPAVLAAAKRVYTGIGQGGGVRGGILNRQVNPYGPRKLVRLSTGLFIPQNVALVGGDEFDTHEFSFAPEADASAPPGFELGWMRDISNTVLAI